MTGEKEGKVIWMPEPIEADQKMREKEVNQFEKFPARIAPNLRKKFPSLIHPTFPILLRYLTLSFLI